MKITIRQKQTELKKINWRELPIGTVVEFRDQAKALVVEDDLVLIQGCNSCVYGPALAQGYKNITIAKILGKISEIIVEAE